MATNRLTIDLRGVTDEPVGIPVQVEVPTDRAVPDADDPGRQIVGSTITRHTNIDGQAFFDLVPTAQLVGRSRYSVRWTGGNPVSFVMPDRDVSLYDIQTTPASPPDTFVYPPSVYYGSSTPSGPATNALWVDTSAPPPVMRIWSGTAWVAVGGGGSQSLSVSPLLSTLTPSLANQTWTNGTEIQVDLAAGTIAGDHPLSVSGNALRVTAGTADFLASLHTLLEVEPLPVTTSGGGRLFLDMLWKLNGTEIPASRVTRYIRSTSPWSPATWRVEAGAVPVTLTGGDVLTLFVVRRTTQGTGNETMGGRINAGNSVVSVASNRFVLA